MTCKFWKRVTAKFKSDCLPQKPTLQDRELGALSEQIQLLTLCAMRKALDADIALVQKRDFFPDLPPDAKDIVPRDNDEGLQQLLDRILWKGDFLTLLYVPGSALKKAMEQSKAYDDEDASKLTISSARSRGLLPLGLKPDPATNGYFVNEVPLDPNRLYAVATTDFIGAGDTGYPDLAASAISPASVSKDFDKLETISSVICRQLTSTPDTACLGKLSGDEYLDKLSAVPADQRPGNGNLQRLRAWSAFHQPELAPKSRGSEDQPVRSRLEEGVQRRTIWELSVDKLSLGFSGLFNSLSDEEIRQKFAGISTKSVTSNQNTKVTYDHKVRLSRSSHSREFFFEHRLNYDVEFLGSRSSDRKVNQKENLLSNEIGFIFPRPGRAFPHLDRVASLYSETQPIEYITTFKLADDKGQISFQQPRSWRLLPRMGLRWDDRESSIEGGAQFGREFGAVNGYIFGAGPKNKCNLIATQNITDCVMELSKQGAVTKDSEVTVLRNDRWLAGAYWKIRLTVPLLTRLKYVLEDDGNFFMVNFHGDKSTDTRFLDKENHQLKFEIWRGLSIGPALNVLLYENKKNRDFLGQIDFRFQVDMNFTIFNKRDTDKQIKYVRPPK